MWTILEEAPRGGSFFPYEFPMEWSADQNPDGWDIPVQANGIPWAEFDVPGDPASFPYAFPIQWADDGHVVGWSIAIPPPLTVTLFKNLGSGDVPGYFAACNDVTIDMFESDDIGIVGWRFENGYYAGVWDGLLQVVSEVIDEAVAAPPFVSVIEGILLYDPTLAFGWGSWQSLRLVGGDYFPYEFPIEFTDDRNVGGYNIMPLMAGVWTEIPEPSIAPEETFPYEFPVIWSDDGRVGGWEDMPEAN